MKKIFFISLILISILTISAAAAAENTTLNQVSDDTQEVLSEKENLNITINYPDEVIPADYEYLPAICLSDVPNDYDLRYFDVCVDGAFDKTINYKDINENNEFAIDINKYSFGNHTLSINLSGNAKYNPVTLTKPFSIVESKIWISDELVSGETSVVSVSAVKGATGTFTVNVDGKLFKKVSLKQSDYISTAEVVLSSLSLGSHVVEAIYSGDNTYRKNTLKKTVNSTFKITAYDYLYVYGDPYNHLEIFIPSDCVNAPVVTINGRNYNVTKDGEYYRADLQYAPLGEFEAKITYPGDKKYPQRTITETYSTSPKIFIYENDVAYDAGVLLRLPEDAKGNLTVYVNNEIYQSSKLTDGEAFITLDLPIQRYVVNASYTGDDYSVENASDKYYDMKPKFIYDSQMNYGETQTIQIRMNPNSTGTLTWINSGSFYSNTTVNMTNGTGNITVGTNVHFEYIDDWQFLSNYFKYEDESGYVHTYDFSITVKPLPVKFTNVKDLTMYYGTVGTFSVKVWGNYGLPVGSTDELPFINFKIGSSEYSTSIAKNSIASIKIGSETIYMKYDPKSYGYDEAKIKLLPGKYKITVIYGEYGDKKITKNLIIKQPLSLKTVKIKRSAKKLTLQATLKNGKTPMKNKAVTFKFKGKTYKTKTNSKGIAKVTIKSTVLKKLKAGKKVTYSATFLKSTVKKTVKVYK